MMSNKTYAILVALFVFFFVILLLTTIYILVSSRSTDTNNENSTEVIVAEQDQQIRPSLDPVYPTGTTGFQQLGTLSSVDTSENIILPLYGRKMFKDRWTYYTTSDGEKNLRIEVMYANRGCMTDRIGCDMIGDGDIVSVPAYNDKEFKVLLYNYAPPF